jgi:hypothetical protein
MRVSRVVPVLAAAVTLAGGTAPPALAFHNQANGPAQPSTSAPPSSGGSVDWVAGAGTAGGIALLAGGVVVNRRRPRRTGLPGAAKQL